MKTILHLAAACLIAGGFSACKTNSVAEIKRTDGSAGVAEMGSRNFSANMDRRPQTAAQKKAALDRLMASSPEEAMKWVELNLEDELERRDALSQILQIWAEVDPVAAWHRAGEVSDAGVGKQLQFDIGYHLSATDPETTIQLASALPSSRQSIQLMQDAAMRWAKDDADGAIEWCKAHADTEVSDALISSIASHTASFAPEETAEIIKTMQPSVSFDRAAYQLAIYWLASEPEACQKWVKSLPEGTARRQISSLIEHSNTENTSVSHSGDLHK